MIAKNLRKFAEALALQLPLPFGRLRILKQARPTTRAGRAARAARKLIRAAALSVKVVYPVKPERGPAPKRTNNKDALKPLFWWAWTGEWAHRPKRMPSMIYEWHYTQA